jgi:hypothetical protein
MNFRDSLASGDDHTRAFIAALKEIFHDERWDDIAAHAERAWIACSLEEDTLPWKEVESLVRDAWSRK